MTKLADDAVVHVYALEFDHPDLVGLVYVGMTWGKKSPSVRVEQHLRRATPESRRYLPPTNDGLRFAGIVDSHRIGNWPNAEADILRSYEAAGWCAPQVNKECYWPMDHTPETRARISAAMTGRIRPPFGPDWLARLSEAHKGKKMPPRTDEWRTSQSAARKGKKMRPKTPETRARISASRRGMIFGPEHRANISAAMTGRTFTPEWRAKLSAVKRGKPKSPEHRAKLSAAAIRRWRDANRGGKVPG